MPARGVDSVAVALAFVARRAGTRSFPEAKWAHTLSFELGWMNPGQARAFVVRARKAGLLEAEGEALRLAFDPAAVEVPRGFRPDPEAVPAVIARGAAPAPEVFPEWLARVMEATGRPREAVLGEVAARQAQLGGLLGADAAILWLAAEAGLDVGEAARRAESSLRVTPSSPSGGPAPGLEAPR